MSPTKFVDKIKIWLDYTKLQSLTSITYDIWICVVATIKKTDYVW